jgi:hypothetical protein
MRDLERLAHSFFFDPPLSAEEIAAFQYSTDPWHSLAYIVHLATTGDFSGTTQIEQLMHANHGYFFWLAATRFVGMAGSWNTIEDIAARVYAGSDTLREGMVNMMRLSCNQAFADRMAELYEAAEDNDARENMVWYMSLLLEPECDAVWMGAAETGQDDDEDDDVPWFQGMSLGAPVSKKRDHAGYRETVRNAQAVIRESGLHEADAVFEGMALDPRQIAIRVTRRTASHHRDRMIEEILLLSAMMGLDISYVQHQPGILDYRDACKFVEKVLSDPRLSSMITGKRYFFGHRVPADTR